MAIGAGHKYVAACRQEPGARFERHAPRLHVKGNGTYENAEVAKAIANTPRRHPGQLAPLNVKAAKKEPDLQNASFVERWISRKGAETRRRQMS
ncbi:MAG TPA: hypothetical protein VFC46_11250 [Humisphaera sp.]|nr:hypothetical protein [Humisphaera sp.]